jgi:Holliday junction resolvasome RuvABC ATP-dependent DNA helicase subunit
MQIGYLERTAQGRLATRLAYEHFKRPRNKPPRGNQERLW